MWIVSSKKTSADGRKNFWRAGRSFLPVLVVVAATLVHDLKGHASESQKLPHLPQHVADMRETILTAARSGKIEELTAAFDLSGRPPDFGLRNAPDPIKALKTNSKDGQGRDFLAALVEVLSMPPVALPLGTDIENNLIYIWPYLAERSLDELTPAEEVDLYRLMTPAEAQDMRKKKRWTSWRLVIAADGSWLSFMRKDQPSAFRHLRAP